jgi:hypothetical protein
MATSYVWTFKIEINENEIEMKVPDSHVRIVATTGGGHQRRISSSPQKGLLGSAALDNRRKG